MIRNVLHEFCAHCLYIPVIKSPNISFTTAKVNPCSPIPYPVLNTAITINLQVKINTKQTRQNPQIFLSMSENLQLSRKLKFNSDFYMCFSRLKKRKSHLCCPPCGVICCIHFSLKINWLNINVNHHKLIKLFDDHTYYVNIKVF